MIAHRRPTTADWQRWAPEICARYRSVPARVLIAKMTAEGLLVTWVSLRVGQTCSIANLG